MKVEEEREGRILVEKLVTVAKGMRKGGTIGIGTLYWLNLRMLRVYKFIKGLRDETRKKYLERGFVGYWRGYKLRIIRGNIGKEGMDYPRPWKKEYEFV